MHLHVRDQRRQLVIHTSLVCKLNHDHFCSSCLNHVQGLVQPRQLSQTFLISRALTSNGGLLGPSSSSTLSRTSGQQRRTPSTWSRSSSNPRGIAAHRRQDTPLISDILTIHRAPCSLSKNAPSVFRKTEYACF